MENAILHVGDVEDDVVMFQMFLISPWWFLHIRSYHSEIQTSPKSQNMRQKVVGSRLSLRSLNSRDASPALLQSNFGKVRWGFMPDFSTTYPSFPVLEAQRLRVTGSFLGSFGTVESGGEKHHVAKVLFKCVCVWLFFCFGSCFNQQLFLKHSKFYDQKRIGNRGTWKDLQNLAKPLHSLKQTT